MLFIPKKNISAKALNRIKRLAAFKNPEFYKAQAMRLSTFNKPRIISCADETRDYICLPRGCEQDLKNLLDETKVKSTRIDIHVRMFERMYNRRLSGYASIDYKMKGELFPFSAEKEENVDIIFDKSNFYPVFSNDINHAKHEIVIASPFVTKRRTIQILRNLEPVLPKKVKVTVVTRPVENFQNKDLTSWEEATQQIETAGIHLIFKPNIHQKFAVIDQKIVWYGSINLLSYGSAEESMMRIESNKIAYELMESIGKLK